MTEIAKIFATASFISGFIVTFYVIWAAFNRGDWLVGAFAIGLALIVGGISVEKVLHDSGDVKP